MMTLLLLYLFLALFTSFLCSIVEAVLLSIPVTFLKAKADGGNKSAKNFLKLKENVDRPLSAILSLNTIAHTVGAAGVGAQAIVVFGEQYFGLVSAILTFLILILTEIFPKTIGASYTKELMGFSTKTINVMIVIAYPLVIASAFLTKLLSNKAEEQTTSREEISVLANIGTKEGVFRKDENQIIQNLIKLYDVRVSAIMTPRIVCVTAHEDMTLKEFMQNKDLLSFSRIPVYRNNNDDITGYVLRSYAFEKLAEDQFNLTLKDIKREVVVLPETINVYKAWEKLIGLKEHISIVVNEYGGMEGILTIEDTIETLMGIEIIDEKDTISDMQQYALDKWKNRQKEYKNLTNAGNSHP
ncbi:MAG: CNNM domain-containing protein [Tannerellaceae bacterium]|jgi:CBS domain containing-hemolysin-like protein|nr:CNNM domain-containing protein [Tannerellaceae bacterium]